jgi:hypothetical protein
VAFATKVRKFIRTTSGGAGENDVAVTVKKHNGDTSIGSANTAGSADLAGLADVDITDYEPHYAEATVGSTTLYASSKDVGFIGTVSGYDLDLLGLAFTDGVTKGVLDDAAVTASGADMNVDIAAGGFIVLGHPARNTASAEVTIGANASGNPRIDRVVVRFVPKGQTTEGDFSFAVLEGTAAASPTAPSLTQSSSAWEISLAQVAVANGAATISQGNVTDERPFCTPRYPADPGGDRILFWDDSAGIWTWLALDTGLSISGTTLSLDDDLTEPAAAFTAASASGPATLDLHEDTDNGTDKITLTAPASVASDKTVTFQDVTGTVYVSGGTDVALADGGTGASLADPGADRLLFWDDSETATAFLSLGTGLAITTTTLGLDADLATIAGLTATSDNFIVSVASAWASRTPAQVRTTLGLVVGTDVQAWDADLDTIAGLTATTDNFIVSVASAWASRTPAQVRTTLGLGTADSPEFTAINLGHASNTTITRTGAGDIAIEGNAIYRASGTDVAIADGGTGQSTATAAFDALAPTTTQGDIIYFNGTDNVRLAKGSATQVLTMNSGATAPEWAAASAGGSYAPGGTDVALADGGTGASLADPNADRIFFWDDSAGSTAFLSLGTGLSITTTTVNLDDDLVVLAGLTATTDNMIQSVGSNWASRTPAEVRTTLGLVVGSDVQAYSAGLVDFAGLTPTDNGVVIGNGANFVVETGSTLRTSLGVQPTAAPTFTGLLTAEDVTVSDDLIVSGDATFGVSVAVTNTVSATAVTTTGDITAGDDLIATDDLFVSGDMSLLAGGVLYTNDPANAASPSIRSGSGSPEGVVAAASGSLFLRTNGGSGSTFYIHRGADGADTGWVALG